jgi:hypothetical protein
MNSWIESSGRNAEDCPELLEAVEFLRPSASPPMVKQKERYEGTRFDVPLCRSILPFEETFLCLQSTLKTDRTSLL